MPQISLYKNKVKIGDKLEKIFYDITHLFTTAIEVSGAVSKIVPGAIQKFEKEITKLKNVDKEYTISAFANCMNNFKSYTDISDARKNEYLRDYYLKLPLQDKDFYLSNREIAISIMEHHFKVLSESGHSVFASDLHFKGRPGDFIELITALYKNGNIERLDKKKLTQKELQVKFRQFFNVAEDSGFDDQNLSKRLSERKNAKGGSLFMEELKKAFVNYSGDKNG